MLDGKGKQAFLTKKHLKYRQRALKDRTRYNDAKLAELELTPLQGQGMTNSDSYTVKQNPYPMDPTIRKKKDVDIREVDPTIGETSD
jgi:hypothetical protein